MVRDTPNAVHEKKSCRVSSEKSTGPAPCMSVHIRCQNVGSCDAMEGGGVRIHLLQLRGRRRGRVRLMRQGCDASKLAHEMGANRLDPREANPSKPHVAQPKHASGGW
jgi:hypothetical protein